MVIRQVRLPRIGCPAWVLVYLLVVPLVLYLAAPRGNLGDLDDLELDLEEASQVLDQRNGTRQAFYFTETSGQGVIRARFVCAVEAVARLHPQADIYLLLAYWPSDHVALAHNPALAAVLRTHPNIRPLRVDMDLMFRNSPLEEFHRKGVLGTSKFIASHTSDVLRFFVVWRYGGTYLDLDFILAHPLVNLTNFIVFESSYALPNVASGMFALARNHTVGLNTLHLISGDFKGDDWGWNGPYAFSRALMYHCLSLVPFMSSQRCPGFSVLPHRSMFPLDFRELDLYFNSSASRSVMARIAEMDELYGYHVGNNIVRNKKIRVGSRQPLGLIARRQCPVSYWGAGKGGF